MAKKAKREVLPKRKDGKRRTKRQEQTTQNNRNWLARKYYDKRHEHKDELVRLRKDNRQFAKMYFDLKAKYDALESR